MKKHLQQISFKKLLIEALSIVFSVLFALWVNQVREDREKAKTAAKATQSILSNMESNVKEIRSVLEKTRTFYRGAEATIKKIKKAKEKKIKKAKEKGEKSSAAVDTWGYETVVIKKSAWQAALYTNAVAQMDVDLISELSDIYELAETNEDYSMHLVRGFSELTTRMSVKKEEAAIYSYQYNLAAQIQLLEPLLKQSEALLKKHKKVKK